MGNNWINLHIISIHSSLLSFSFLLLVEVNRLKGSKWIDLIDIKINLLFHPRTILSSHREELPLIVWIIIVWMRRTRHNSYNEPKVEDDTPPSIAIFIWCWSNSTLSPTNTALIPPFEYVNWKEQLWGVAGGRRWKTVAEYFAIQKWLLSPKDE